MDLIQALRDKNQVAVYAALDDYRSVRSGGNKKEAIFLAIDLGWEAIAIRIAEMSVKFEQPSCVNATDEQGNQPLFKAIDSNMEILAQRLVELGAIKFITKSNDSLLTLAVSKKLTKAVLTMIKSSVDRHTGSCLEDSDKQNKKVLILAIETGQDDVSIALIKAGANMSCHYNKCRALPMAVKAQRGSVALAMIERSRLYPGISCLNDTDKDNNEALLIAIKSGQDDIAIALVEAGARMSCQQDGCSALPMAVKETRVKVALAMIERSRLYPGISCLNDTDKDNNEALIIAIKSGQDDIAIALIKAGAHMSCHQDGCSALPMAVKETRVKVALAMIERSRAYPGISCLNDTDKDNNEALLIAIKSGQDNIAIALIKAGARMSCHHNKCYALPMAVKERRMEVVLAMIERSRSYPGISCLNDTDQDDNEALILAIKSGQDDIAIALIKAGASMLCHQDECYALPMAVKHQCAGVALAMIERSRLYPGISCLNNTDKDNNEALIIAIKSKQDDVAIALVKAGAHMSCHHDTCYAFPMAVKEGCTEIAMAMISRSTEYPRGSCLKDEDKEGKNAFFLAVEKGETRVAMALAKIGSGLSSSWSDCEALPWTIMHGTPQLVMSVLSACEAQGFNWSKQSDAQSVNAPSLAARAGSAEVLKMMLTMGLSSKFELKDLGPAGDYLKNRSKPKEHAYAKSSDLSEMALVARKSLAIATKKALEERSIKNKMIPPDIETLRVVPSANKVRTRIRNKQ